jgi:hypothetical protein
MCIINGNYTKCSPFSFPQLWLFFIIALYVRLFTWTGFKVGCGCEDWTFIAVSETGWLLLCLAYLEYKKKIEYYILDQCTLSTNILQTSSVQNRKSSYICTQMFSVYNDACSSSIYFKPYKKQFMTFRQRGIMLKLLPTMWFYFIHIAADNVDLVLCRHRCWQYGPSVMLTLLLTMWT